MTDVLKTDLTATIFGKDVAGSVNLSVRKNINNDKQVTDFYEFLQFSWSLEKSQITTGQPVDVNLPLQTQSGQQIPADLTASLPLTSDKSRLTANQLASTNLPEQGKDVPLIPPEQKIVLAENLHKNSPHTNKVAITSLEQLKHVNADNPQKNLQAKLQSQSSTPANTKHDRPALTSVADKATNSMLQTGVQLANTSQQLNKNMLAQVNDQKPSNNQLAKSKLAASVQQAHTAEQNHLVMQSGSKKYTTSFSNPGGSITLHKSQSLTDASSQPNNHGVQIKQFISADKSIAEERTMQFKQQLINENQHINKIAKEKTTSHATLNGKPIDTQFNLNASSEKELGSSHTKNSLEQSNNTPLIKTDYAKRENLMTQLVDKQLAENQLTDRKTTDSRSLETLLHHSEKTTQSETQPRETQFNSTQITQTTQLESAKNSGVLLKPATAGEFSNGLRLQQDFAPGLAARIQWVFKQALSGAEIMLDPPELGPLSVKVQQHNGDTSIVFQVNNNATRDLLQENLPKLREALEQQGINLADTSVESQSQQSTEKSDGSEQAKASSEQTQNVAANKQSDDSDAAISASINTSLHLLDVYG